MKDSKTPWPAKIVFWVVGRLIIVSIAAAVATTITGRYDGAKMWTIAIVTLLAIDFLLLPLLIIPLTRIPLGKWAIERFRQQ